ncbi:hypothetical protein BH09PSE1_BH09PSE1_29960 [soil metagenome]
MLHLALGDQVLDRSGDVLDRHVRIDAVLIEQVDDIGAKALQRGLGDGADVFGPAVQTVGDDAALETELGGDDDAVAEGFKRLAEQVLVGERAVAFGRVEEGHAAFDRTAQQGDAIRAFDGQAEAEAQAHATEAEGGDLEAGRSEGASLHAGCSSEAMSMTKR